MNSSFIIHHSSLPLYIDWNPSVEAFKLGSFSVRWYALCWILGLVGAYLTMRRLYKQEGIDPAPDKKGVLKPTGKFDPLVFYCFFGVLLGARLGHCLFYEPDYFLSSGKHIIEMLLPIKFAPDSWDWKMTGYSGLASHGGAIGLFLAMMAYLKFNKIRTWLLLDMMGIVAPFTSFAIRMGNLMNSEIIGRQTDMPWGFYFHTNEALVDGQLVPRHPAQLYEALFYLIVFLSAVFIYQKQVRRDTVEKLNVPSSEEYASTTKMGTGFFFGYCLTTIFLFRFFVEFLKEVQGGVDDGTSTLDMGQMLSIPFVVIGLFCMIRMPGKKRAEKIDRKI